MDQTSMETHERARRATKLMTSIVPHNAAHQRQGKEARILRFAKCVTL
jgi:hypothetical protein